MKPLISKNNLKEIKCYLLKPENLNTEQLRKYKLLKDLLLIITILKWSNQLFKENLFRLTFKDKLINM